jgi:predicted metal-dependent hydrolase
MPAPRLLQGIEKFNRGHFFEAHELWEELWNEVVGEEKRFYQGLVQVAAGYHKLSLAQANGARKLLGRGRQTLAAFSPHYAGVDLTPLLATVETAVRDLATGQPPDAFQTPEVRLLSPSPE